MLKAIKEGKTYRIPGFELTLVREKTNVTERNSIRSPEDAYLIAKSLLENSPCEKFIGIFLDTKHHVLGTATISKGTLDMSVVSPRELFQHAFLLNAAAIIVAHNHPSGNPSPSKEDHISTDKLIQAGKILDIAVLDHVIVGLNTYISFKNEGYI